VPNGTAVIASTRVLGAAAAACLAALTVATASPQIAAAQSVYGESGYGSSAYAAEQAPTPLAPNTGFEAAVRAAADQPLMFWAAVAAVLGAVTLATLVLIKRKQEN